MRIGFTGTQLGMTPEQAVAFKDLLLRLTTEDDPDCNPHEFHSGDCIGADEQAFTIARVMGHLRLVGHPPEADAKRAFSEFDYTHLELSYRQRNKNIVDCTDILVACPNQPTEVLRSGTWMTIRMGLHKANMMGYPVLAVTPSGAINRLDPP